MEALTHNDLPRATTDLLAKADRIISLLLSQTVSSNVIEDKWMDLDELVNYDPEKRAKATFYSYTQNPTSGLPFHKRGKKLIFLKSEIDAWLKQGKNKTNSEISDELDNLLSSKK
ncbi:MULTISPECIES: MerR family transcriptional regulator [Arenibacter]|uniref:helix-turn-helix domain-containing protein n=1 Tax=Arenibacter TaxID=178469 RepID=UPI0004DEEA01|nr:MULTISPECIES: helix-turn-helix domain-containing protein [Arenibacter]GBF19520.1 hypothetical protein C21_01688 [Arenibacter sp. NBRC 103722]|tara:strand:- start:4891 stop:5235 length:345 start_codon:yes stop_codon:yes gene_type:complete